jgi:hypothetical protein
MCLAGTFDFSSGVDDFVDESSNVDMVNKKRWIRDDKELECFGTNKFASQADPRDSIAARFRDRRHRRVLRYKYFESCQDSEVPKYEISAVEKSFLN